MPSSNPDSTPGQLQVNSSSTPGSTLTQHRANLGSGHPRQTLRKLTSPAKAQGRGIPAALAPARLLGRLAFGEQASNRLVGGEQRVAGARRGLLPARAHVADPLSLRALRVRAGRVVELESAKHRVEVDLLLRDEAQGLEARHEALPGGLMRAEARELRDVAAAEVHQDGLRGVIEVQAGHQVVGAELARGGVQGAAAEDATVAAGDGLRVAEDDLVHLDLVSLAVGEHPVLDPQGRAEGPRRLDAAGAVLRDPLVHGHREEAHVPTVGEGLLENLGGGGGVLPPAEADDHGLAAAESHLAAELLPHAALDEIEEVRTAQVLTAVADPSDRRGGALRAVHAKALRWRA